MSRALALAYALAAAGAGRQPLVIGDRRYARLNTSTDDPSIASFHNPPGTTGRDIRVRRRAARKARMRLRRRKGRWC